MKTKIATLVVSSAFLFCSCGGGESTVSNEIKLDISGGLEEKTDVETLNLRGNVKSISDGNDETTVFNKEGMVEEIYTTVSTDGGMASMRVYKEKRFYDEDGTTLSYVEKYRYRWGGDIDTTKIDMKKTAKNGEEEKLSDKELLKKEYINTMRRNNYTSLTVKYNGDGNITKFESIKKSNTGGDIKESVTSNYEGFVLAEEISETFEHMPTVVDGEMKYLLTRVSYSKKVNNLNEQGDIISESYFDEYGEIESRNRDNVYSYTYDTEDNWTSKMINGKLFDVRVIEYYK